MEHGLKKNEIGAIGAWGALSMVGNGIRMLLEFAVQVVIGRFFGPAIMGMFAIGVTATNIGRIVSQIGFEQTLQRYLGVYRSRNDEASIRGLLFSAFSLPLVLGMLIGGLLYFSSFPISVNLLHKPELTDHLRIFAFSMPFLSCLYVLYQKLG
jgi:O-antigen/teichoic acid export membrane protein